MQTAPLGKEFSGIYVDWEKGSLFFNGDFNHAERGLYGTLGSADAEVLYENCQRVVIGRKTIRSVTLLHFPSFFFNKNHCRTVFFPAPVPKS